MKAHSRAVVAGRAVVAALLASFSLPAAADPVKLLAGAIGTDSYAFAGAIQRALESHRPEQVMQVQPGTAIGNIEDLERGSADFAFTFSILAVDAVEGRRPFKEKAKDLCHVVSFTPQVFHIAALADSEVHAVMDLKGKAAAFRPRGTTLEQVTAAVLAAHSLTYADFRQIVFGSRNDGVQLMKDAEVDVFVLSSAPPAPALRNIAAVRDLRLIPLADFAIERLRERNRGYRRIVLEPGAYPRQDNAVATIGYLTHLVARCSLDDGIVYHVTSAIVREFANVQKVSREAARLGARDLANESGIPFHPGAVKALVEAGLR